MTTRKESYEFKPLVFQPVRPRGNLKDGTPLPMPRSGHRIVCFGLSFYSFGSYNPKITTSEYPDDTWQRTHPLFHELWQFNIVSSTWTRIEGAGSMPEELASHSAVRLGPNMLVFGGTAMPFGDSSSDSLYMCHLPTGKWQKVITYGNKPEPMYGQAVCLSDDKLYVVGGTTGFQYSIDVHCLDLTRREWVHLNPRVSSHSFCPEERYRHEVVEHEGALYVFGGGRSDAACDLTYLPTFLIKERIWVPTKTYPDPVRSTFPQCRRCHVACKFNNFVYIHGGYNGVEAFADLWRLSLSNFEWQKLPCKSPVPLYFHSAAVTEDGCMYMFGGVKNLEENKRTARITKVWLSVGKLRDMCWEALCHYTPTLPSLPPATLLQMGIPIYIVDSLQHQTPAYG
ncbi:kelch domain-containing protein 10-like [Penaeus chinensis]|uniref:kelch domain-containing protein 10-like n=1 Tax=Penaeus chinensis TaxID=139456 RepID=UPI001FB66100|nr:kelch domain-containing protein 10-like [Penaeus chinensis]